MNRPHPYKVQLGGGVHVLSLLSVCVCSVYCQCSSANLTATETYRQELTSPGYPSDYSSDLDCVWYITADNASHVVQLVFMDLSTEDHGICYTDYLAIYDGNPSWYSYVGRYCGTKIPENILSTGDLLTVKFRTDSLKSSRGFKAKYISGPESSFLQSGNKDSSSSSVILGASVGAVVFVVVMATVSILVYKYIKDKKLTNSSPQSRHRRHLPPCRVQPYDHYSNSCHGNYPGNQPPPAYTEICDPPMSPPMSPPPAYSETEMNLARQPPTSSRPY